MCDVYKYLESFWQRLARGVNFSRHTVIIHTHTDFAHILNSSDNIYDRLVHEIPTNYNRVKKFNMLR